ncbi:hypothetical protein H632_c1861p0 [Helicosporidium sp. ATCC 50920]|nr:hypothetical protein H632_c1861p0 [Helicosporidium sp. ATCC 50920]|eukprot:KDD73758.1 hypothetical protein H632_c1861p0 [Helicosporidium sp. ATCC 50920]
MARGGDKRRLEANKEHIRKLQIAALASNALFLFVRIYLRWASTSRLLLTGVAVIGLLYAVCYGSIANALAPAYNASGELIFAGQDPSMGGVMAYYHDILYIVMFIQILGSFTDWAWLALLLDVGETAVEKKRREKKERQAARNEKFAR